MNSNETIKYLLKEKQIWLEKIKAIDQTIELLRSGSSNFDDSKKSSESIQKEENNIISAREAIQRVLKEKQRFVKAKEFAKKLAEINNLEYGDAYKKVSPTLSILKKKGLVTKVQVTTNVKDTYWGSPKWLDEDGNIIEQYNYIHKPPMTVPMNFDI